MRVISDSKFHHDGVDDQPWLTLDAALILLFASVLAVGYLPAIFWLAKQVSDTNNFIHFISASVLLAFSGKLLWQNRREIKYVFNWNWSAFFLLLTANIGYLANEYFTGIHIFSSSLLIIATYALIGFYSSTDNWQKMLIPAGLLIALMPFEGYFDIYLGFPLRLLSAAVTENLLGSLGVAHLSVESILVIENRAAIVDLNCSGLKGLWAGLILYLSLTWIENKRVNLKWFAGLLAFIFCLLVFNILRIVILVLLELVLQLPELGAALHVPLGIIGFVISCAIAWLILYFQPSKSPAITSSKIRESQINLFGRFAVFILLFSVIILYTPKPKYNVEATKLTSALPVVLAAQPQRLNLQEQRFFSQNSAHAEKYSFQFANTRGSILFVTSQYWKSQHDPRNCYISQGYSISGENTLLLEGNKTVKQILLNSAQFSAVYWYQSSNHYTSDFASRVLHGWRNNGETWLMVSILIEGQTDTSTLNALIQILEKPINNRLGNTEK